MTHGAWDSEKRGSLLQNLFRTARLWDELAVARLRRDPRMAGLRTAHTRLFPHLDLAGTRLVDLAARLGVTKQSVAPLVDELVAMGVLERVPDPDDGRARLLRFVGGADGVRAGLAHLLALEQEISDQLGPMTAFSSRLLELHDLAEALVAKERV